MTSTPSLADRQVQINLSKQELTQLGGEQALDTAYADFASSSATDFLDVINQSIARLAHASHKPTLESLGLAAEPADIAHSHHTNPAHLSR